MKSALVLILFFVITPIFAQKKLEAKHIKEKISIDGELNEPSWSSVSYSNSFTQVKPYPGKPASRDTKVAICYDDEAIYFAAICYDQKDSVSQVLSLRDDYNANLDAFGIFLDTYNDDQNGFGFGVTSQGVQLDFKIASTEFNDQLNLVWNSVVKITDTAWIAEIKIPFSAIRFPKKQVQDWGINFSRQISRYREESTWSPVNPDLENYLLEAGAVVGIEDIDPPLRLALMPYVSSYVNHSKADGTTTSINGGMDIKYGINEALTLDVTLVPDFGQVVFDQQVLNISPFEIQFNENRQFFTEGTELFTKAGLFYSRRIGVQAPQSVLQTLLNDDEYLSNLASATQLYNASKVSGRLKNGLGVGVFNGITAPQYATAVNKNTKEEREILASPLTNYNVLVFDQNLKNNSSITFTNTNVWRAGSFYDANVSAFNFNVNTKDNKFNFNGKTTLSAKFNKASTELGYNYNFNCGKQRGAFIYGVGYLEESDTYDPNDLGFNAMNNRRNIDLSSAYRIFNPKWSRLTRVIFSGSVSMSRLYNPNVYTGSYWDGNFVVVSSKFNAAGIRLNGAFTDYRDYFEPRMWGRVFNYPSWQTIGGWVSSNYQKKVALDAGANYSFISAINWKEFDYNIKPRFRLSDHIFIIPEWTQNFQLNSQGYAVPFGIPVDTTSEIVFGTRNRIDITSSINLDYNITNRMGLTFRLRHYRSSIKYLSFSKLNLDGSVSTLNDFSGLDENGNSAYNINFNAFTIDLVYRWVFLPGSEINVVWKNSIFTSDDKVAENYFYNLRSTFNNGPTNSVSVKVIYWLDYLDAKKLFSRKKSI
ncbi:MAG: carbohydrate binding family 9 domain-containing protein [Bacteroidetes bacterium]|nr:carbohydrate binding family 9 domain-containing protein [Bacteroidota bacterium]